MHARCGAFTGTCHFIHAFSVNLNGLLPKKDGCHNFNTRNRKNVLQKYTEQKHEFELKFGFEPGSVRFEKILKFAEP